MDAALPRRAFAKTKCFGHASQQALPRGHALALANEFGDSFAMRKNGKQEFSVVVELNEDAELLNLPVAKLKRIAALKSQIERLQSRLAALAGNASAGNASSKQKILSGLHTDICRLTGLAPADWDAEEIYHEHLAGRHT